jgi:tetratricopeptide (TPR) repeat protein
MRFHQMLHAALASIFVVPAVTLTSGDAQGLEQALTETVRAVESLAGLETEMQAEAADDASGAMSGAESGASIESLVSQVLIVTEQPMLDGPKRDGLLATLRRDVSRLQMVLDDLTPAVKSDAATMGPEPDPEFDEVANLMGGEPPVTTGLNDETREALKNIQPPVQEPNQREILHTARPKKAEAETFTADALRLGHAYYRAGRYAEGLIILSKRPDDVEARYWSGRCLEHMEKYEEAIEVYAEVVSNPEAGYFADRAKSDLSFLSWKLDFAKRIDREGDR